MNKINIGLQLYTLRDLTALEFEGTLRKVAELGYQGVEFAGYGDIPAEQMKSLLDELGLQGFSSHVSLEAMRKDLQKEIDYLKTIGAAYMICPFLMPEDRPQSSEEWSKLFSELQEIGTEVSKQGLIFGYHNHDFEFIGQAGEHNAFDGMFMQTTSCGSSGNGCVLGSIRWTASDRVYPQICRTSAASPSEGFQHRRAGSDDNA